MAAGCALTLVDKALCSHMLWSELRVHTFLEIHLHSSLLSTVQSTQHCQSQYHTVREHHPHSHRPSLCVSARAGTAVISRMLPRGQGYVWLQVAKGNPKPESPSTPIIPCRNTRKPVIPPSLEILASSRCRIPFCRQSILIALQFDTLTTDDFATLNLTDPRSLEPVACSPAALGRTYVGLWQNGVVRYEYWLTCRNDQCQRPLCRISAYGHASHRRISVWTENFGQGTCLGPRLTRLSHLRSSSPPAAGDNVL